MIGLVDLDEEYAAIFGTPSAPGDTIPGMRSVVYLPADRPDVEVLVDGEWCEGELRMWLQHPDGSWWGDVQWRRDPGATYLGSFPTHQLRQV